MGFLSRLFGGGGSSARDTNEADEIHSGIILSDLARYNEELSHFENLYADRLLGPQSQQDRSAGLQTVANNTDQSFGRAYSRIEERRRKHGLGDVTKDDSRRLQISQQVAKAKNTTDYGRFFDRNREGLL